MNIRYFIIAAVAWTINQTALSAQTPLNTRIDERYGNTTVVYKDKNTTDAELLNRLDKEYGMGDVIRITQAPPAPASVAPSTASQTVKVPQKAQASGSMRPVLQTRMATASPKTPAQRVTLPEAPVVPETPAAPLTASTDRPELFLQNLTRPATAARADASPARPVVHAEESTGKTTKVVTAPTPAAQTKVVAKPAASATVAKTAVKTTGHKQYYKHKSSKHFSLKKWWANIKPAGKQRYKCYRF